MPRRMADSAFREQQARDTYAEHVEPINRLVDTLRDADGRGWMPYVAPWHGGIEARVLSILRDPGPKTRTDGGSGFLCVENDDPTAERMAEMLTVAGIAARDVTPWNAYPWYINRAPKVAELIAGLAPLKRVIELMPDLEVVLLQGTDAQAGWRRFAKAFQYLVVELNPTVIETYHPSRQALWHPDAAVRDARTIDRAEAYRRVAVRLATG